MADSVGLLAFDESVCRRLRCLGVGGSKAPTLVILPREAFYSASDSSSRSRLREWCVSGRAARP
ncbi:hypothetical protein GCM10010214_59130 [Streptomyces abikoensis]|nr:hypothetical protein GCM10010214_59130 [Streptomyces abikoensis]